MPLRLIFGYVAFTLVAILVAGLIGAAIRLMTQETPSSHPARTAHAIYVVKRGDVLSGISEKTGLTVSRLMALNPGLDPLELAPGQRIRLRPLSRQAADRARRRRSKPRPRYYVVRPGDGLSTVAARTGVPQFRLLELNKRAVRHTIVPGQRLKLRR